MEHSTRKRLRSSRIYARRLDIVFHLVCLIGVRVFVSFWYFVVEFVFHELSILLADRIAIVPKYYPSLSSRAISAAISPGANSDTGAGFTAASGKTISKHRCILARILPPVILSLNSPSTYANAWVVLASQYRPVLGSFRRYCAAVGRLG